jgi:hypothetical protein
VSLVGRDNASILDDFYESLLNAVRYYNGFGLTALKRLNESTGPCTSCFFSQHDMRQGDHQLNLAPHTQKECTDMGKRLCYTCMAIHDQNACTMETTIRYPKSVVCWWCGLPEKNPRFHSLDPSGKAVNRSCLIARDAIRKVAMLMFHRKKAEMVKEFFDSGLRDTFTPAQLQNWLIWTQPKNTGAVVTEGDHGIINLHFAFVWIVAWCKAKKRAALQSSTVAGLWAGHQDKKARVTEPDPVQRPHQQQLPSNGIQVREEVEAGALMNEMLDREEEVRVINNMIDKEQAGVMDKILAAATNRTKLPSPGRHSTHSSKAMIVPTATETIISATPKRDKNGNGNLGAVVVPSPARGGSPGRTSIIAVPEEKKNLGSTNGHNVPKSDQAVGHLLANSVYEEFAASEDDDDDSSEERRAKKAKKKAEKRERKKLRKEKREKE